MYAFVMSSFVMFFMVLPYRTPRISSLMLSIPSQRSIFFRSPSALSIPSLLSVYRGPPLSFLVLMGVSKRLLRLSFMMTSIPSAQEARRSLSCHRPHDLGYPLASNNVCHPFVRGYKRLRCRVWGALDAASRKRKITRPFKE